MVQPILEDSLYVDSLSIANHLITAACESAAVSADEILAGKTER